MLEMIHSRRIVSRIVAVAMPAILISTGCSHRPPGVLSESEMVDIMTDLQIAEAYNRSQFGYQSGAPDEKTLGEGVLGAHGVTRAEYDSTLSWYGRNLDEYEELYVKVDKNLESRRKSLERKAGDDVSSAPEGDDLWPYGRHYMIRPGAITRSVVFSIPSPDITRGDRVEWKLRVLTDQMMTAMLGVEYEDGIMSYVVTNLRSGGTSSMVTLQTDTAREVRRLFGTAFPIEEAEGGIRIDSLALRRLPIDSAQYFRIRQQKRHMLTR